MNIRKAVIQRRASTTVEQVEAYLPSNYKVTDQDAETITISGEDVAGWTLDGYVIPRLASGLIWAQEVGVVKCATVGCRSTATVTIAYDYRNDGNEVTEDVCGPCADSYSRRPVLTNFRRA